MYEAKIATYEQGAQIIRNALKQYPVAMRTYKPSENAWSIHEVIIHLADSEVSSYMRLRKIIAENGSSLADHDADTWAREIPYHEQSVEDALQLIETIRAMNARLMRTTDEHIWATHAVVHPTRGSITLEDWLQLYINHVKAHLNQMERIYQQYQHQR